MNIDLGTLYEVAVSCFKAVSQLSCDITQEITTSLLQSG